ncbi:hypothetical protein ElyMa_000395400 [Elysia marginata]|uniref:Uncharacterized protein n=1 Tax=Elysia marginata TaxID=1093978 RepID=A0AAV4FJI4_9GAST|nr:hypothetical protein ElyMa_000395400 [Elysia marginata]
MLMRPLASRCLEGLDLARASGRNKSRCVESFNSNCFTLSKIQENPIKLNENDNQHQRKFGANIEEFQHVLNYRPTATYSLKQSHSYPETAARDIDLPFYDVQTRDKPIFKRNDSSSDLHCDGEVQVPEVYRTRSRSVDTGNSSKKQTPTTHTRKVLKPAAETLTSILRKRVKRRNNKSLERSRTGQKSPTGKSNESARLSPSRRGSDLPTIRSRSPNFPRSNSKFTLSPSKTSTVSLQSTVSKSSQKSGKSVSLARKHSSSSQSPRKTKSKEATLKFPICETVKVKLATPEYVMPDRVQGPRLTKSKAKSTRSKSKLNLKVSCHLKATSPCESIEIPQKPDNVCHHKRQKGFQKNFTEKARGGKTTMQKPTLSSSTPSSKLTYSEAALSTQPMSPRSPIEKKRSRRNMCRNNCGVPEDGACDEIACGTDVTSDKLDDDAPVISPGGAGFDLERIGPRTGANAANEYHGNQGGGFKINDHMTTGYCEEELESSSDEFELELDRGCVSEDNVTLRAEEKQKEEGAEGGTESCTGADDSTCDFNNFLGDARNAIESRSDSSSSSAPTSCSESSSEIPQSRISQTADLQGEMQNVEINTVSPVEGTSNNVKSSTYEGTAIVKDSPESKLANSFSCQEDQEPRLTVRQMVKCLQDRLSSPEGGCRSNFERGPQSPPKRRLKEWKSSEVDAVSGPNFEDHSDVVKSQGGLETPCALSTEKPPKPTPRKLVNVGGVNFSSSEQERDMDKKRNGFQTLLITMKSAENDKNSEMQACEDKQLMNLKETKEEETRTSSLKSQESRGNNQSEQPIRVSSENSECVNTEQIQTNGAAVGTVTLNSSNDLDEECKEYSKDIYKSPQQETYAESQWAEACEKAKTALRRIRSRSLSPHQVRDNINWLVEKGKLSLNKVIKSWSSMNASDATSVHVSDWIELREDFKSQVYYKSDVCEHRAGPSGSTPPPPKTATQGDSNPPIYCLRINSPTLSRGRSDDSEIYSRCILSTGVSSDSNSDEQSTKRNVGYISACKNENENEELSTYAKKEKTLSYASRPDIENPSCKIPTHDKITTSSTHLRKCEPPYPPALNYPSPLTALRARSPPLESILETDSVSESIGHNLNYEACDCRDEQSESVCMDELPQDNLKECGNKFCFEVKPSDNQDEADKIQINNQKLESNRIAADMILVEKSLHPSEVPTRASVSDCSRESRHNLEEMSGQDDLTGLLSSAPLKTQSLVNACDAVLSESGMTDMMALLSQEANIRRYPSYLDLTDIENDEEGEAGGALGPKESISAMAELDMEDSEDLVGNDSNQPQDQRAGGIQIGDDSKITGTATVKDDGVNQHSHEVKFQLSAQIIIHDTSKHEAYEDPAVNASEEPGDSGSPPPASAANARLRSVGEHHNSPQTGIREPEVDVGTIVSLMESCKVLTDSNNVPPPLYGSFTNLDNLHQNCSTAQSLTKERNFAVDGVLKNREPGVTCQKFKTNSQTSKNSNFLTDSPIEKDIIQVIGPNFNEEKLKPSSTEDNGPLIVLPSPPLESPCESSQISDTFVQGHEICRANDEDNIINQNANEQTKSHENVNILVSESSEDLRNSEPQITKFTYLKNEAQSKTGLQKDVITLEYNREKEAVKSMDGGVSPLCRRKVSDEKLNISDSIEDPKEALQSSQNLVSNNVIDHVPPIDVNAEQQQYLETLDKTLQQHQPPSDQNNINKVSQQESNTANKSSDTECVTTVLEAKIEINETETKESLRMITESSVITDDMLDSEENDSSLTGIQAISASSGAITPDEKVPLDSRSNSQYLHREDMDFQERFLVQLEPSTSGQNFDQDCRTEETPINSLRRSVSLENNERDEAKLNYFSNENSGCDLSLNSLSRSYRSMSTDEDKSSGAGETLPLPCDVELKKKKRKISKHLNSGEGPSPQPSKAFKVVVSSSSRSGGSGSSTSNSRALSTQSSPDINTAGVSNVSTTVQLPRPPPATLARRTGGTASRHGRKEIKWDDEISFGDQEEISTQSSSEMSSNRCNSCASERSKGKGVCTSQRKRASSLCKINSASRLGHAGERGRARRDSMKTKSYKSQVRRSPPPAGMTSFDPRKCLAKTGAAPYMRKMSVLARVSRSLPSQVTSHTPFRSLSSHGDSIGYDSLVTASADSTLLVNKTSAIPGGDVDSVTKYDPRKHPTIRVQHFKHLNSRQAKDKVSDVTKTLTLLEETAPKEQEVSDVSQAFNQNRPISSLKPLDSEAMICETNRPHKDTKVHMPGSFDNEVSSVYDIEGTHYGEQTINNNHSSDAGTLLELRSSTTPQLASFPAALPHKKITCPILNTEVSKSGSSGSMNSTRVTTSTSFGPSVGEKQDHQYLNIYHPNFDNSHSVQPSNYPHGSSYLSSSMADLRSLTAKVRGNQEEFVSRLFHRVNSTDMGLARAYNFVSRSQLQLDRCDRLIERSSHIIRRSEEILAASRSQMENTANLLSLNRKN